MLTHPHTFGWSSPVLRACIHFTHSNWVPIVHQTLFQALGKKQKLLPVSARVLQVLRTREEREGEEKREKRVGESLPMSCWRRGKEGVWVASLRLQPISEKVLAEWTGNPWSHLSEESHTWQEWPAFRADVGQWLETAHGKEGGLVLPCPPAMVDADERGCWGLRSLTFPAAGDLRGRHCLPGVDSLEGETGVKHSHKSNQWLAVVMRAMEKYSRPQGDIARAGCCESQEDSLEEGISWGSGWKDKQ